MKQYKAPLLFVIILLIISNTYAQTKAKTNRFKNAKLVVKTERVLIETGENDTNVAELGYYIQNAILEDSLDNYMSKFDISTFGKFITSKTERDKSLNEYRTSFLKGISSSIISIPKKIISEVQNDSYYDFVNYSYDIELKTYYMLFRIFSEETGINYHNYRVSKRGDEFVFSDIYIYLSGESLSETFGRMYLYSIPKSKLLSLFGSTDAEDFNKLLEVTQLYKSGKFNEAYKKMNRIKGTISDDKFFLTLKNIIAANINEDLYLKCIEEILKEYPNDPSLYLTEADYYIYKGEYDEALNTLDKLIIQTEDNFLNYLKANLEFERGNFKTSQDYYKIIVDNYPDFFSGISNYLASISNTKDFMAGIDALEILIEQGYEKPSLIEFVEEINEDGTNEFESFAKSQEYNTWKTVE